MNTHQKQSECFGVVNIHCLLCVKAMECQAYLAELYPTDSSELVQAPLSSHLRVKTARNLKTELGFNVNAIHENKINDIAVAYLNYFMQEKLDEIRVNLQKINDIEAIQFFLEEQKEIVLSLSISELTVNDEREKFESLKRQYLTLLDLYLG